ncbi:hypothetical protein [Alicyclobacillus dauci]|uniref:Uncharacterized protein n=1 Tax=Alicyclobacillus dauci TaxID=1475485 RepID=A0ABY6YYB3_9BACL|nr:hypothetical protein [Alicyclobacillus dauci]WAH35424.1 hypothetical protein NZD86_14075 [Alicyclobacillus dauci]
MENPRKGSNRNDSDRRRGQVVDLRSYQNRRRKDPSGKRLRPTFQMDKHIYLRALCYGLMGATVILAVVGLLPIAWRTQALIWAMFVGTVGLGCGLWLNAVSTRPASRILLLNAGAFVIAYLCSLLHLFS